MKKNCIFLVTFIKSLNQSSIKPCLISGKLIKQMRDVCLFCFFKVLFAVGRKIQKSVTLSKWLVP